MATTKETSELIEQLDNFQGHFLNARRGARTETQRDTAPITPFGLPAGHSRPKNHALNLMRELLEVGEARARDAAPGRSTSPSVS